MKVIKRILLTIVCLVLMFWTLIAYWVVTAYDPEEIEQISAEVRTQTKLQVGDTVEIMTWNLGYSALGETADFFMDGGKMVNTATREQVLENLDFFLTTIEAQNPDIVFLQEVDRNSKRSHYVDSFEYLEKLQGYVPSFAYNFLVDYVPYPIPNIGRVESGIATFQKYSLTSSERIQLFCPFDRLIRAFNLRRCLLVNRIPLENSEKELVLINLHLEAYDSGEGKIRQTQQLRDYMLEEELKGNYVIVGGDFNQVFDTVDMDKYPQTGEDMWMPAQMEEGVFDGFHFVVDDSVPTCRSLHDTYFDADKEHFQYYVIDGFIVSDNVEVIQVETKDLQFSNSDHNPVVMQIKLK